MSTPAASLARLALCLGLVVVLSACGEDPGDKSEGRSTPGGGSAKAGAACTKQAIEEALREGSEQPVKVTGFECAEGWASGSYLVGKGKGAYEAAYLVEDDKGSWTVPKPLPCEDRSIPEKILNASNCRVS